jgi:hypothetical protein
MPEWSPPVTRHHCPLCDWHTDDPGPDAEALRVAVYPEALARQHAAVVEAVLRGHLKTHPLEEWAAEVTRLREQAAVPAADLTADLEWLLAAGLDVQVTPCGGAGRCCGDTAGRFAVRAAKPDPVAVLPLPGGVESHGHASPGEALAFARDWCERNGIAP